MNEEYDVFIVGAGIVACTFARILVDAGLKVVMADAGAQHSQQAGENLKNFQNYQTDVDQFGGIVRGLMHPVSIPVAPGQPFTRNALNPYQKADKNLPGAVAAYAVGGMAIHWTCAIPRHHKDLERIKFISDNEWEDIYSDAEIRLKRNTDVHTSSLRHQVLKNVLKRYKRTEEVKETPLAAVREGTESVRYTGADTVLKDLADPGETKKLTILREHRVSKLNYHGSRVQSVEVRDLKKGKIRCFMLACL